MGAIPRRRVLKLLALAGTGSWLALRGGGTRPPAAVRRTRVLMGTTVNLTVAGADRDAAAAAADATLARMADLEALLSRYRPDSDVGRLNREGVCVNPSAALLEVLDLADRIHGLGDGAFDVTIQPVLDLYRRGPPERRTLEDALTCVGQEELHVEADAVRFARAGMALTLDGVGKGYIVDEAVKVLQRRGFGHVLVEAGGDLVARGRRTPDRRWRIGIRHPRPRLHALLARIDAEDIAVATSGDYFQPFTRDRAQHHIMDPRTGRSGPELASATVLAPTAALADGLATLALASGARRTVEIVEEQTGCEACLVTKASDVITTSGFPRL